MAPLDDTPSGRTRVYVLQSRQPLTTDPADAFPPDRWDVVVLTDGPPDAVLREDVHAGPVTVVRAARDEWESMVTPVPAGGVEVVTNDEYCVAACARLREAVGLPRRHPKGVDGYLDKVVMKRLLAAAGVLVPRVVNLEPVAAPSRDAAEHAVASLGLPVVAKPRREANSRGVEVLEDVGAVRAWLARHDGEPGWELEEFVAGELGHVNAIVRRGRVEPVQAGRYLGPLLEVSDGRALGGWTVSAGSDWSVRAHALNLAVVEALGTDGEFVVHTEFVATPDGRLVVLETAARAPGAGVSELALIHAGVQLETSNLRMQAGLSVPAPEPSGTQAAWLWLPVLPGRRWDEERDDLRAAELGVDVRVRRVGSDGNDGASAAVGAFVVVVDDDAGGLARTVGVVLREPWFRAHAV